MEKHIHPIFDKILQRQDKEILLGQKSCVIWMTGLSGSGKSTLARTLEQRLHQEGYLTKLLDGDNLRTGVNSNLAFSQEDRLENIRRVAEVSKLFFEAGVVTVCSLISPTKKIRKMAQDIIGKEHFYEVFINCPFEVCAQRDVKGLYAKAIAGEIKNFTGLDAPFEAPQAPFLELKTDVEDLQTSQEKLVSAVLPLIKP